MFTKEILILLVIEYLPEDLRAVAADNIPALRLYKKSGLQGVILWWFRKREYRYADIIPLLYYDQKRVMFTVPEPTSVCSGFYQ